ncbi:aspartate/glutamate racemase family protein [Longimicrobium sp.]|uniref:aspartate/glutamate racemase family protein n=1 Tax=Longimicrobium sp. TaxID=2029185 RepID=UPI002EDB3169
MDGGSGYMLGVLGGMGPIASAAFVRDIYDQCAVRREQETPRILLYSDPTVPDRTEALLSGADDTVLEPITRLLELLAGLEATEIVMCCVTAHALLHRLPTKLRARVVSLVELALREAIRRGERQLMLCTDGTRRLRVFENHPLWSDAKELVVLPDEGDQKAVHCLVYRLKGGAPAEPVREDVAAMLRKYQTGSFIAGCTEMHLLWPGAGPAWSCVDPLRLIAASLGSGRHLVPVHADPRLIAV